MQLQQFLFHWSLTLFSKSCHGCGEHQRTFEMQMIAIRSQEKESVLWRSLLFGIDLL